MIEIEWNRLEREWWFELGISLQKTSYHEKNFVLAISFIIFTIYIRF